MFKGRFDFMKHRKLEHRPAVTKCRHALYGTCMFGEDKCWFVHENDKNEKIIQNNQEVFEKLFNMMEKMTERIVQMETVIWIIMEMKNGNEKSSTKWKWIMDNEMQNGQILAKVENIIKTKCKWKDKVHTENGIN